MRDKRRQKTSGGEIKGPSALAVCDAGAYKATRQASLAAVLGKEMRKAQAPSTIEAVKSGLLCVGASVVKECCWVRHVPSLWHSDKEECQGPHQPQQCRIAEARQVRVSITHPSDKATTALPGPHRASRAG